MTCATAQENPASIYLAQSHLEAQPAVVGEKDDESSFTRELVRVQWRPADPIYLYILVPKLVPKPPVILYLYTYDTGADRFLNQRFGEQLTKGGFAAVGFSAALSGHRYHDRPLKQWFVSEFQESLGATAHDIQMIVNYLVSRGDLDTARLGMFGEGSGASAAILAAAADSRLKALDLLNPWGDWPTWLVQSSVVPDDERARYLTPEFLKGVEGLDPLWWLPRLRIPIRLQYLGAGTTVPKTVQDRMAAAAPEPTLIVPSEQGLAEYRANAGAKFLDWIKDRLRSLP